MHIEIVSMYVCNKHRRRGHDCNIDSVYGKWHGSSSEVRGKHVRPSGTQCRG